MRLILLFDIALISCRRAVAQSITDRVDEAPRRNQNLLLRHQVTGNEARTIVSSSGNYAKWIERSYDVHSTTSSLPSSSRLLQTQSWKTNNNYNNNRNSGINYSDGTPGQYYWEDRIKKGLHNVGIFLIIWFAVIGLIGTVCRCYLCCERILGDSSFRYSVFHNEVCRNSHHHDEEDRSDGIDLGPTSSFDGHQS